MKAGYKIEVASKRIEVKVWGAWDFELTKTFYREVKQAAQPLIKSPWLIVIDFFEWELATPESFPLIAQFSEWAGQNNLADRVVVAQDGMKLSILKDAFGKLSKVPTLYCENLNQVQASSNIQHYFD